MAQWPLGPETCQTDLSCVSHREEVYDGLWTGQKLHQTINFSKRFVDVQGSGMMMQFVHVFMNI